jgi:hypothetical protein
MEYGTHHMQLMPAAGAARQVCRIPSATWSHTGIGIAAVAKPRTDVVTAFGDLANHRQPEEAPL